MKKFLIAVVGCAAFAVMAGPHGCHHGNDGVRLAADIVDLVGASLNILAPQTVITTPVVTTPVVAAPVVTPVVAPVVVRPAVYPYRRYYRPCRPCPPPRRGHGGCRRR